MACPCSTLPRPGGSPVPSGRTSMFQPATSVSLAGLPKPYCKGAAATTGGTAHSTIHKATLEHLDIAHLARCIHAPRLDRVVVIDRARAAHGAQLTNGGLHEARVVHRARLQQRGLAVPCPVEPEARQR